MFYKTKFNQVSCDIKCSGNGECDDGGDCFCDPLIGWSGAYCEVPGCPRHPENDIECSGHGDCNSEDRTCSCFAGWMGVACHIADCPGEPNCYEHLLSEIFYLPLSEQSIL
jgi:hypothetical protein